MTAVREAMIVAGGKGTRLMPLTLTTPKPLLPLCGSPFLSGMIRRLAEVGIDRVFLIVGAHHEGFEVVRDEAAGCGVHVELVDEPVPLDTAGGVRAAIDRVSGTFLVLNGDVLADFDLSRLIAQHCAAEADATLALTRVSDTSAFGVCVLEGTRVVGFVEKPDPGTLPGQDAINAGAYVLELSSLSQFPAGRLSFEREVFPQLVQQGARIEGVVHSGVWADLGTPERFLSGQRLVLDRALSWLGSDEIVDDTEQARIRRDVEIDETAVIVGPVWLGRDVRIESDAVVGPYAVLGHGTRVCEGAQLRHSAVFDDSEIGQRSRISESLIGFGVRVGSGAELAGCVVADDQQIAADSRLAEGSRVSSDASSSP